MSQSFEQVQQEFNEFLNDQAGAYLFAYAGMRMAREKFRGVFANANPDKYLNLAEGNPADESTLAYQRWRIGDLDDNLSDEGIVATKLGCQWIVAVFAQWEHDFRPRLAAARSMETRDYIVPVFGDFRLIRNDILHNGGIASDSMDRLEVVDWFSAGDTVRILPRHVEAFMGHLGLTFRP